MTKRSKRWLIVGAVLLVFTVIGQALGSGSAIVTIATVGLVCWLVVASWWLAWRVWRWATYRVGVRLFVTYVLIGVLPLLFAAAFAAVGLYILMGQYTSVRIGSEIGRLGWGLKEACERVLETAIRSGPEAAESVLAANADDPPDPLTHVLWYARLGEQEMAFADDIVIPEMEWLPQEVNEFVGRFGDTTYRVIALRSSTGNMVVALLPLDDVTARDISSKWWFDTAFFSMEDGRSVDGDQEEAGESAHVGADGSVNISVDGQNLTEEALWGDWTEGGRGLFSRPLIIWFRVVVDVVDLETGEPLDDTSVLALLRTSPKNVWQDFTLSRYELATELWGALAAIGVFFLLGYGIAMATAATLIASISRSTTRLSQGALEVERGNLDYRIPVKRNDQLGDLGRSFNHMTESVQSMLADVAEKERLAKELELAREIQESLLPEKYLEFGPVSVRATFQPAAEVGGDYFDIFSMADDRLVVAVGDVAGHGLSTGLLMASLKSSVAALVFEGYSGADLIERTNRLLMEHGQARTMVTLSVIEIDPIGGRVRVANAGHPPAYLIPREGAPEELMLSSIPLGSPLCRPALLERAFPAGSRIVLYSDGLVEAVSAAGEPFGYERLEKILEGHRDRDAGSLTAIVMSELTEWVGGAPLADDLTLLVIERAP